MKIQVKRLVEVGEFEAETLVLYFRPEKVVAFVRDADGKQPERVGARTGGERDRYDPVPDCLRTEGSSFISFEIDLETGQIVNWEVGAEYLSSLYEPLKDQGG